MSERVCVRVCVRERGLGGQVPAVNRAGAIRGPLMTVSGDRSDVIHIGREMCASGVDVCPHCVLSSINPIPPAPVRSTNHRAVTLHIACLHCINSYAELSTATCIVSAIHVFHREGSPFWRSMSLQHSSPCKLYSIP